MEIVTQGMQPIQPNQLTQNLNPWQDHEKLEAPESYFLDPECQAAVTSLIARFYKERREKNIPSDLVIWNDLEEMLLPEEMEVIRYLNKINPREIGFYGPRVEDDGDGADLVEIDNQTYLDAEGNLHALPVKFIPNQIKEKLTLLNEWLERDGLEPLIVESGYRSPAYQAILFLKFLSQNEFDIRKTAKRVALPGYSEHGSLQNTAIDVTTENFLRDEASGRVSPTDFAKTETYGWLITKGKELGVAQTYTDGNVFGIQPEPWHFTVSNELILVESAS